MSLVYIKGDIMFLGNLSISSLEQRTGWTFSDEDRKWLEFHRQDNATVEFDSGRFHIFDIPFCISVSCYIKNELLEILQKYFDIQEYKEPLRVQIVYEDEKHKSARLEKEKQERDRKNKLENPNSVWNVKWHMLVPITLRSVANKEIECYYGCFINTYITGRTNIPDIIDGVAYIKLDEVGFHGSFDLNNPEKCNDADKYPETNYVIGIGPYNKYGIYFGSDIVINNYTIEHTVFSIRECIQNYKDVLNRDAKEIHFDRIKGV